METVKLDDLNQQKSRELCIRVGLDEETVKNYVHCFEQLPPITVYAVDGELLVVDGNHRVEAARRIGLEEIDAECEEGTIEDAQEAAALANVQHGKPLKRAEKRAAIDRMLKLHTERADNYLAGDIGVSDKTVTKRREQLEATSDIPKLSTLVGRDGKERPRSIEREDTGEQEPVFTGKVHTLDVMEGLGELPNGYVDLIVTDPPYNLNVSYSGTNADRKPDAQYYEWCAKWFAEARRVLNDSGSLYVMHYPEVCAEWKRELDRLFTFRSWITWVYPTNVGHSKTNWTRAQRTILFYTRGENYHFDGQADPQPFRNPDDKRIKKLRENGQEGVTPYDWWEYNLVKNVSADKTEWPNQIPVELVERIIKTSCPEDGIVLDPFMGSGTAAVAAVRNGYDWIGFDQEPRSAAVTAERVVEAGD